MKSLKGMLGYEPRDEGYTSVSIPRMQIHAAKVGLEAASALFPDGAATLRHLIQDQAERDRESEFYVRPEHYPVTVLRYNAILERDPAGSLFRPWNTPETLAKTQVLGESPWRCASRNQKPISAMRP